MTHAKLLSVLLLSLSLLGGCTLAPGTHFSRSDGTVINHYPDSNNLKQAVEIYPITAGLLNAQAPQATNPTVNDSQLRLQISDFDYTVGPGDVQGKSMKNGVNSIS